MTDYLQEARDMQPQLSDWRRDFHRNPELSLEETRTAEIVAQHLKRLDVNVKTGVGGTGVVGLIDGNRPGPTVLLRLDMDALPIQEENNTEYVSQFPGKMHACGHDGHTAMGMGAATLLSRHRQEFSGKVMLIFEPAEETSQGAQAMIEAGILIDNPPDYSISLHIEPQIPAGKFGISGGPVRAAADRFRCVVKGKGGHGAEPHNTVDPIAVTAQIINALQTIVSRNVGPLDTAVVSIGSLHAGQAFNIIPEHLEFEGTIRTYKKNTQKIVHNKLRKIIEGTASMMGATAELEIIDMIPAIVNDQAVADMVRQAANQLVGPGNIVTDQRSTVSDDAGYFLQAAPGCYFSLGAGRLDNIIPLHSPHFDWDESAMPLGVALLCSAATRLLQQ
jgi:amidohydrolase